MTITFDLSDAQATRLENARRQGVPIERLFDEFLARLPDMPLRKKPEVSERNLALIALLQSWNAEDDALNNAEEENRLREGEQFSASLQANRVSLTIP